MANYIMLDQATKHQLRGQAHALKPSILLGSKGLTPAVLEEIENTLMTHELIKIKLTGVERQDKARIVEEICTHVQAECVQMVGHMASIYRPLNVSAKVHKKQR